MFNDYNDGGFEFFNGDIQQQYFNYYMYTEMTDDDPFDVFEDDGQQGTKQFPQQRTKPCSDNTTPAQHCTSFSSVVVFLMLIFYTVLLLLVLGDVL